MTALLYAVLVVTLAPCVLLMIGFVTVWVVGRWRHEQVMKGEKR